MSKKNIAERDKVAAGTTGVYAFPGESRFATLPRWDGEEDERPTREIIGVRGEKRKFQKKGG